MSKNRKIVFWVITGAISLFLVGIFGLLLTIKIIGYSGITQPFDNKFGDQHLKTAVALIELHNIRYGEYPEKLSDVKFIGDWDIIHLNMVSYYPNEERTAYYLEVNRGWVGKPSLSYPDEFWKGTGYREGLKPANE